MSRTGQIALVAGLLGLGIGAGFWLTGDGLSREETASSLSLSQAGDPSGVRVPPPNELDAEAVTAVAPIQENRAAAMRRRKEEGFRPPKHRNRMRERATGRATQLSDWEFNRAALAEAGYDSEEIDRLQQRFEAARDLVMETLGLNRYAGGSELSAREAAELAADSKKEMIPELPPEDRAAILFATGQNNAVVLGQPGPLARSLGLKNGDQLWMYGGERIYAPEQYLPLMRWDREQGVEAQLSFKRGARIFTVSVPKGMFGAPFYSARLPP